MGLEGILVRMKRAVKAAENERSKIDQRWSSEERQKCEREISEALATQTAELQQEGLQAWKDGQREARSRRYKARAAGEPKDEEWAEAQARAFFIAEDLQRVEPEEVPEMYEMAQQAGDLVGAWLLSREGTQYLEALRKAENTDRVRVAAAVQAVLELEKLTGEDKIEAEYKENLAELQGLWRDLQRLIPSAPVGRPMVQF